jgi:hypothetical protein
MTTRRLHADRHFTGEGVRGHVTGFSGTWQGDTGVGVPTSTFPPPPRALPALWARDREDAGNGER